MKKILTVLIVVVVGGCGRPPDLNLEQETPVYYEVAWVDPQVIIADSQFTLIRAARIDSFIVAEPVIESVREPAVSFQVTDENCPVTVNILDEKSARVRWPLLVKHLSSGFYKLTLDFSRTDYQTLPPGYYVLKVDNCGLPQMKLFLRE